MKKMLQDLREVAVKAILGADDPQALESLRIQYLGKKGDLTKLLKMMGKLDPSERPAMGQLANQVRAEVENALAQRKDELSALLLERKLASEAVDVTIPGKPTQIGHEHPMYVVLDEIKDIFIGMGFEILEGPEVELADYNFTKLNTDEGHPAREWSDTFYLTEDSSILLRTQTSPMQIRAMEENELPIRMLAPGRVYRKDEVDATHSPIFHQMEGLVIDENITMGDLKGTLDEFARQMFGEDIKTRFRPSFFPFTEPSAEVDLTCANCRGEGCRMCKGTGWIEVLGAGMVNPKVLEMCGIDSTKYSGFAFGMGVERMALLKYNIPNLRYLYENDLRFLTQYR